MFYDYAESFPEELDTVASFALIHLRERPVIRAANFSTNTFVTDFILLFTHVLVRAIIS